MNRLEANRELIGILVRLVEKYPEMRFSQILSNFGYAIQRGEFVVRNEKQSHENFWIDDYNLESRELLKRVLGKVTTIGAKLYETT